MTTPATDGTQDVRHNADEHRYEVWIDGERVGHADYEERDGTRRFVHTEVDDQREGRGIGSALVKGALDDTVEAGLGIVPVCPFVVWYVDEHPEYADHVHDRN